MAKSRLFAEPGMVRNHAHYGAFDAPFELDCDYVVIDVETTGFEPSKGARVIEFAAHRTRGDGKILESYSTLINHGSQDTGAVFIHGITPDLLNDAPTFEQAWPAIESIMSNAIVVAHNATFDMAFVDNEVDIIGREFPTMPAICTYWLSRESLKDLPNYKLTTIAEHLGVLNDREHDASADAKVVVEAMPHMLKNIDTVRHFVGATPRIVMPEFVVSASR